MNSQALIFSFITAFGM